MVIAANNELPKDYDAAAIVSAVVRLHDTANENWPEHLMQDVPIRNRTEFDVAKYFEVMKHISPPDGQVLDYVYLYWDGNGSPCLYLRATNAAPFRTFTEYVESFGGRKMASDAQAKLFATLRLDGTPESFFEQFIFNALAGQFYLAWHEKYNDCIVVTTSNELQRIIEGKYAHDFRSFFTTEQNRAAQKTDFAPCVKWLDEKATEVSVVIFSKWGGLYRITRKVARAYPHIVETAEIEEIVKYNCGVVY